MSSCNPTNPRIRGFTYVPTARPRGSHFYIILQAMLLHEMLEIAVSERTSAMITQTHEHDALGLYW